MRVVLIIIAAIALIIAAVLWLTVTFEIASNGRKTIITVSVFKFIKHEFVLPVKKTVPDNTSNNDEKNKRSAKSKNKRSRQKKRRAAQEEGGFREELKSMWDSEARWFDFENIDLVIRKYTDLISHGRSALAVFLRRLKRKIRISRLDLYIKFGLGSPDKTGIAYGAAYAAAGNLNAFIMSYFKSDAGIRLYPDPDYVNSCFEFELGSIIKTRVFHVARALIAALAVFIINHIKGSVEDGRNFRQASDRGSYGHRSSRTQRDDRC